MQLTSPGLRDGCFPTLRSQALLPHGHGQITAIPLARAELFPPEFGGPEGTCEPRPTNPSFSKNSSSFKNFKDLRSLPKAYANLI